jgi:uncharacterized repeat protein (TIGR03803 family)
MSSRVPLSVLMVLFLQGFASGASGQTYAVLYRFSGNDGRYPQGVVLVGTTLYGTTYTGGNAQLGTAYRLSTDGSGFQVLEYLSSDAYWPLSEPVISGEVLYATTSLDGSNAAGTIFQVGTDGSNFQVIKRFTGTDGQGPIGKMAFDGVTLYGVTESGGSLGFGSVFRIDADGSNFSVLQNFQGTNGGRPEAGLILSDGILYGTMGGQGGARAGVFRIKTDGSGFAVLEDLTGYQPNSELVLSGSTLYGTTSRTVGPGNGTIFSVNIDGSGGRLLRNFTGADGATPGTLALAGSALVGTALSGGKFGDGTVFQLFTNGSGFTILKDFAGGSEGGNPLGSLAISGKTIYGSTLSGGTSNTGSVFALSLTPPQITEAPRSQTAEIGSAVSFSVTVVAAEPLTYKWFFNTNVISGPTQSVLELTTVQLAQAGAYFVVVTNVLGAVTSAPANLALITPVSRKLVPGVSLYGQTGSVIGIDHTDGPTPFLNWTTIYQSLLTEVPQWYFDVSTPSPSMRFFRCWQTNALGQPPSLDLSKVTALMLTGSIGSSLRVDYINQFGPTNAWVTLDTVTLTNTFQLYFDPSALGKPARLYRLVPQ